MCFGPLDGHREVVRSFIHPKCNLFFLEVALEIPVSALAVQVFLAISSSTALIVRGLL